jgi:hypothetical protein
MLTAVLIVYEVTILLERVNIYFKKLDVLHAVAQVKNTIWTYHVCLSEM